MPYQMQSGIAIFYKCDIIFAATFNFVSYKQTQGQKSKGEIIMEEKRMLNEEELKKVTGGEIESSNTVGYTTAIPNIAKNKFDVEVNPLAIDDWDETRA